MLRVYAAALGVDMASIQWVASIYIIVTCAALLYGGMSDSIGCPVTSYVEGHPDVFMTACTPLSWLLAFIVGASAIHASRRGVTRVLQSESA